VIQRNPPAVLLLAGKFITGLQLPATTASPSSGFMKLHLKRANFLSTSVNK
jgi:hypothetical protein